MDVLFVARYDLYDALCIIEHENLVRLKADSIFGFSALIHNAVQIFKQIGSTSGIRQHFSFSLDHKHNGISTRAP